MFDLSLGEIALVLLVAVLFIGPKDVPVVVRALGNGYRAVRRTMREIRAAFDDVAKEAGLKDIADGFEGDVRMIKGDDGTWYEAYDVKAATAPPPKKKEEGGDHAA